jgi:hypothetical protein
VRLSGFEVDGEPDGETAVDIVGGEVVGFDVVRELPLRMLLVFFLARW